MTQFTSNRVELHFSRSNKDETKQQNHDPQISAEEVSFSGGASL
jgi:hypothetical protein